MSAGEIASDAREYGRRYTKVYDIMSKLVVAALGGPTLTDWRAYRDNCLLQRGSHAFQANLFPLGKPSLPAWPVEYASLFGLRSGREYYERVRGARFELLRSNHKRYAPKVTVCFGRTGWSDFGDVFALRDGFDDSIAGCRIYPSGVVLTPFFNYPYLKGRIEELGQRLHHLLVGA